MKYKTIQWLPISLCVVAMTATQLTAQPFGMGGGRGDRPANCAFSPDRGPRFGEPGERGLREPGMGLLRMSAWLELTDAQESKILELSQQFRSDLEQHRSLAEAAWEKIDAVRSAESFDEVALREALESLQPIQLEGMVLRESYRHAIEAVLTDDQKAKLQAADWRRGKRDDWRSQGRGPRADSAVGQRPDRRGFGPWL
ncbi:MAG: Spy/CpxP family protein refolding chaperone [Puniceicoccaceae bacterium]